MKTARLLVLLLIGLLVMVGGTAAQDDPPPESAPVYDDVPIFTLDYGGVERAYGLYLPSTYDAGTPAPLILALHGRFGSAKALHALSGLAALAEARGALLVYPETYGVFWNDGGHDALERREEPSDDAGFIGAVVRAVQADYAVDADQLFLIGYDSGGVMSYRLACEGVADFAGVAAVSALMWDFLLEACPPEEEASAAPLIILHGWRDPLYPFGGGPIESFGGDLSPVLLPWRMSVGDTLSYWNRLNGCAADPTAESASGALYHDCESGADLAYVGLARGGHDWFHAGDAYQLNRHGIEAMDVIDSFFFERESFALPEETLTDDAPRSWLVYVPPSYDPAQPTPAVVALHGRPGSASGMAAITDLNRVADAEGFIAVYPDGLNNEWNSIGDLIGATEQYPQDDVTFLKRLMDDLSVDLNLDRSRLYVTGFSNGGFMTMRLACSAADTFAAFASVGATFYPWLHTVCRENAPAPILLMHGTDDVSIPFDGVFQRDAAGTLHQVSLDVPGTLDYFVLRSQCQPSGVRSEFPASGATPGVRVFRFDYLGCVDDADVTFYLIVGGGHNWPGVPGVIGEEIAGTVTMDINAGEEIWAFFERHTLN
ncbi:MAG: dienelactone hydrolase family protein [Anaerolineae bacterium]|nr:dienelactone hydrolase family protein [Anaerolineae bacterium]NUQ07213.1 dienelactone hydrolase family protein [Anaerolineae bacterium]